MHVLRTLLALTGIGLAAATAAQLFRGHLSAAAFVAAYLAWMLSEARITAGSPRQSVAETRTLVPYAVARVTTALTAAFGEPALTGMAALAAVTAFLAGVVVRAWAVHELGERYSHRVVRICDGGLVSSGPYRVLRHPAYAGMLLANIGFVGYFANPVSIVALFFLVAAILWRIKVEEGVLGASPDYRAFASGKRRILPGVW